MHAQKESNYDPASEKCHLIELYGMPIIFIVDNIMK